MIKPALAAGCLLALAATAEAGERPTTELRKIHAELLTLYTPRIVRRAPGEHPEQHSGHEAFTGNCEDFYAAAFSRLQEAGFLPWGYAGKSKRGVGHLMACADADGKTYCLDPQARAPISLARAYQTYRYMGELHPYGQRTMKCGTPEARRACDLAQVNF